ncbi:MAG: DUF5131 family protein [Eubacteriales bacterium]|nr:DUF5131 family protein [Eubacteriales bacterium]
MKPLYEPKGRAKEYGDLCINIYTGCPHGCYYCYAAKMAARYGRDFTKVEPRPGIVEATKHQLEKEQITGKLIHLCFTCDPFPKGVEDIATISIIKLLKAYGNHVQILTKNPSRAIEYDVLDLLDGDDWFGTTISCNTLLAKTAEPNANTPFVRLIALARAMDLGIKTWISCEPVLEPDAIFKLIIDYGDNFDKIKIGKLNYFPSNIKWHDFGHEAERLCKLYGRDYYIKADLRAEMDRP